MSLDQFRKVYLEQHLASLAETSGLKSLGTIDRFQALIGPIRLSAVNSQRISEFQSLLRNEGLAESTIAGMLKTLHAALSWAKSINLLRTVPTFPRMARAKSGAKSKLMKGRPITDREFLKMLGATGRIVGKDRKKEWQRYLRGLWLSGLRLKESIVLYWDRWDKLGVDLTGRRPMLRISSESEKGNRDRLLPITPDFADFLMETPKSERIGPVFPISRHRKHKKRPSHFWVSRVISKIGKSAKVVVDSRGPKYASAHDLRRSFGDRWSRRVMPQVLMELMRHESIETTLRYYVGRNAESTSDAVYAAFPEAKRGDTAGDRHQ